MTVAGPWQPHAAAGCCGQGPYRMFYSPPPRQELAVRGEHKHPQVHRCSTQPSEKTLGRRLFSSTLRYTTRHKPHRRVARAGKARPKQIELETGENLEDGSEEELG